MILVANRQILHRGVQYNVGDHIPMTAEDIPVIIEWIKVGSAYLTDSSKESAKARPGAARAGLGGLADTGQRDIFGDDLIGRVPRRTPYGR